MYRRVQLAVSGRVSTGWFSGKEFTEITIGLSQRHKKASVLPKHQGVGSMSSDSCTFLTKSMPLGKKPWSRDTCLKFSSGLSHMVLLNFHLYGRTHSVLHTTNTTSLSEFQASPTVRKVPSKGPSVICSSKRWPDKHFQHFTCKE